MNDLIATGFNRWTMKFGMKPKSRRDERYYLIPLKSSIPTGLTGLNHTKNHRLKPVAIISFVPMALGVSKKLKRLKPKNSIFQW
jgi:hypothetical protein